MACSVAALTEASSAVLYAASIASLEAPSGNSLMTFSKASF